MMSKNLLLFNPGSGQKFIPAIVPEGVRKIPVTVGSVGAEPVLTKLQTTLQYLYRAGFRDVEAHVTRDYMDVVDKCKAAVGRRVDTVFVFGGDGTVNAALSILRNTGIALGVLPGGTANVFARFLHIPLTVDDAVSVLQQKRRMKVDIGACNGDYFGCVAGMGFDAWVIKHTPQRVRAIIGNLSFIITAFRAIAKYRFKKFRVIIDDKEFDAFSVIVQNGPYYGGDVVFTPDASLTDGYLDCIVFKDKRVATLFHYLWAVRRKQQPDTSRAQIVKARTISIPDTSVYYHLDGEPREKKPVTISVEPHALNVYAGEGVKA
ncbi:MAG: YegS/Rv2252/BmrU family lipid kinase [Chitinivibrionales bacterium]|nr:YegS/Rv2252/BmrU family lipid kinase [Chitinivibrionales bacterium]